MKVSIDGMHCDACVRRVRKAVESIDGAAVEHVEVGAAQVAVDSGREPLVLEAIRKAGYEPHVTT